MERLRRRRELATDGAQMITDAHTLNELSQKIIGASFRVGNALGSGFAEKVYENSLAHELRKLGLNVQQQVPLKVWYDGVVVGEFVADLIVEESIVVEIKAVEHLIPVHVAQCINYLATTAMPLCLLINFAGRVEVKRLAGTAFKKMPSVSICAPSVANSSSDDQ